MYCDNVGEWLDNVRLASLSMNHPFGAGKLLRTEFTTQQITAFVHPLGVNNSRPIQGAKLEMIFQLITQE
jgi:hypothetical protein